MFPFLNQNYWTIDDADDEKEEGEEEETGLNV